MKNSLDRLMAVVYGIIFITTSIVFIIMKPLTFSLQTLCVLILPILMFVFGCYLLKKHMRPLLDTLEEYDDGQKRIN